MPKIARKSKDIEAVKKTILDAAIDLIYEEGFTSLSMRKIALKSSMTAANIYNYFANKDEIYLEIQTMGFSILHQEAVTIESQEITPFEKLRQFISGYIEFGIQNPDIYEIMFTRNTPKYKDYVGTALEGKATIEKDTALKSFAVAADFISQISTESNLKAIGSIQFRTMQIWTACHGIVSLHNSRVLQEVDENTELVIEQCIDDLMAPFEK
ncbi:TetR/AcrR family transcriptional regulator [bacterium]|nr:TetR/AcrR family transcriptional regulator [bacterium]